MIGALRERGYLETEIHPTTRLEIEWSDFDGYVEHLRAQSGNAAQNARYERRRNRKSGVCIRQLPNPVDAYATMYCLFRDHYRHKNGREPLEGPQFLPRLQEALGEDHLADAAAALGLKTLLYGNSALDAKRRRGCRVVANHLFYRPHRRFVRVAAKPYFSIHRAWYRRKLR